MKKTAVLLLLLSTLVIASFSCSNQPRRSRKPVSNLTLLPAAQNYMYGNTVSVRVETKLKNGEISNVKLLHNGNLIKETDNLDFTVENIKLEDLGNNTFQAIATKTDNVSNSRAITATVLSDTAPVKYTYSTVRDYPHSKGAYTQGLEYHDGYLYEGTGEYGSSGLFKVNLNTGKPVMQHLLDNKYFGEGITILNNKIYQLTYRSQKGFVYQLDNFAVIDSFTYSSKEGWGLTNDGEYLIMSNGTHELIWLDPEDFSEVKKIQVANRAGLVNYLNELEYINGTIYANVYTTNIIVQIDPDTGKVLSEIYLDGILKMYTNPNDTVDYLNGIAYDAETDRLFVTGKWWPRMFQIELVESK